MPNHPTKTYWIVADDESPDQYSFENDGTSATLVLEVAFSDFWNAVVSFLGYSAYDPGSPTSLTRYLPLKHPIFPWLRCTKITNVQMRGTGGGSLAGQVGKIDYGNGPILQYALVRLTCLFQGLPYNILDDNEIAQDEFNRYVAKYWDPTAEYIKLERGLLCLGTSAQPGQPPGSNNETVLSNVLGPGKVVAKADLTWKWYQVPEMFLFDRFVQWPDIGVPTNIQNGIGKVNLNDYHGYRAGTLLMLPPKITPVIIPAFPANVQVAHQPRAYDVEFHMKYFEVKITYTPQGGGQTVWYAGHNYAPWPFDLTWWVPMTIKPPTPSGIGQCGAGGATTQVYDTYDFNKLFQPALHEA